MFWSLLTALVAAFAGVGIAMGLRYVSGKRLPAGIVPVGAGVGMLVATIAAEYGWAPNVQRTMAADLVIIAEREQQAWYQPWTYVSPWVRGFVGYSPSETVETVPGSGILVVQLRRQERWQPEFVFPNLIDCDGQRRAEILPETTFSDTGEVADAQWLEVGAEDPIVSIVCEGEAAQGT